VEAAGAVVGAGVVELEPQAARAIANVTSVARRAARGDRSMSGSFVLEVGVTLSTTPAAVQPDLGTGLDGGATLRRGAGEAREVA
jgi:hypothetical protein